MLIRSRSGTTIKRVTNDDQIGAGLVSSAKDIFRFIMYDNWGPKISFLSEKLSISS
jgi:hypothetical protein